MHVLLACHCRCRAQTWQDLSLTYARLKGQLVPPKSFWLAADTELDVAATRLEAIVIHMLEATECTDDVDPLHTELNRFINAESGQEVGVGALSAVWCELVKQVSQRFCTCVRQCALREIRLCGI